MLYLCFVLKLTTTLDALLKTPIVLKAIPEAMF